MSLMANQFLDEVSLTKHSNSSVMNVVDQEEIDPPEDTTMLIWDPDLLMPSDDLFEIQEPPVKVLVVQTQSRDQPVSNDLTTTQNSGGISTSDNPKAPFFSP
jgi:hypothetical protein